MLKEKLKKFLLENVDSFYLSEEKNTLVYVPSEENHQLCDELTERWKFPLCVRIGYTSHNEQNEIRVFVKPIFCYTIEDGDVFRKFVKRQDVLEGMECV